MRVSMVEYQSFKRNIETESIRKTDLYQKVFKYSFLLCTD